MTWRRLELVVVGVVAGVVGAIVANVASSSRSDHAPAIAVKSPRNERRITYEVVSGGNVVAPRAAHQAVVDDILPAAPGDARLSPRELELLEVSGVTEQVSFLTQKWESEGQDASWSASTEEQLRTAVANVHEGAQVLSLACKTTICQLVVEHPNRNAQETFLAQVQWEAGFRGEGMMRRDNTAESTRTLFFLGRDGHEMLPE